MPVTITTADRPEPEAFTVTVRLSPAVYAELEAQAQEADVPSALVARELITRGLRPRP